jgi:hypothetical protein
MIKRFRDFKKLARDKEGGEKLESLSNLDNSDFMAEDVGLNMPPTPHESHSLALAWVCLAYVKIYASNYGSCQVWLLFFVSFWNPSKMIFVWPLL